MAVQAAYEVLSDPRRRREYDLFERQRQFPSAAGFAADDMFSQFFGARSADPFASYFQSSFGRRGRPKPHPRRRVTVERPLHCTLEEIWQGVSKSLKVTRRVMDSATAQPAT